MFAALRERRYSHKAALVESLKPDISDHSDLELAAEAVSVIQNLFSTNTKKKF